MSLKCGVEVLGVRKWKSACWVLRGEEGTETTKGTKRTIRGCTKVSYVRLCADMFAYVRIIWKKVFGNGGIGMRKGRMDSLAPARSVLSGFWLRPDSSHRLPGDSSHKIGFPKPTADGFPLCKNALSRKAGNVKSDRVI